MRFIPTLFCDEEAIASSDSCARSLTCWSALAMCIIYISLTDIAPFMKVSQVLCSFQMVSGASISLCRLFVSMFWLMGVVKLKFSLLHV